MNSAEVSEKATPAPIYFVRAIAFPILMAFAWYALQIQENLNHYYLTIGAFALLAWVSVTHPAIVSSKTKGGVTMWIGVILGVVVSAVFRFHYIQSVPLGYNGEALNFVFFADRLVREGFPYIPFSWYAHTLFSYIIAAGMLIFDSALFAHRFAGAVIGTLTLVFAYLCFGRNMTRNASWIGLLLLGASNWLAFATRNGFHQQLIPLFQLAFTYFLFDGLTRRRFWPLMLAGISMVLGLHGHYGYYLMPVVFAAFLAYLILLHRGLLRAVLRPFILATILTLICLIPLALFYLDDDSFLGYLNDMRSMGSAEGSAHKIIRNYEEMGRSLFGMNPKSALSDSFTAVTAIAGLLISLRRMRSNPFFAFLIILTGINALGILVTVANTFYVIALMAPIFAFSTLSISAALEALLQLNRRSLRIGALLALAGALAYQSYTNYMKFFYLFRDVRFVYAYGAPSNAFLIFENIRNNFNDYEIFLPNSERERDFEIIPSILADQLKEFKFICQTRPFDARTILFPQAKTGISKKGIRIYLANVPLLIEDILKTFRSVYPGMKQEFIPMPPPYKPEKIVLIMTIPIEDLRRQWGYSEVGDPANPESGDELNYFDAPVDGFYRFRFQGRDGPELWLNGRQWIPEGEKTTPDRKIFLEKGIHLIRIRGDGTNGRALEFQSPFGDWFRANDQIVHVRPEIQRLLAPYLSKTGEPMTGFKKETRLKNFAEIRDAYMDKSGNLAVLDQHSLTLLRSDLSIMATIPAPPENEGFVARLSDRWMVVGASGMMRVLESDRFVDLSRLEGVIVDVDSNNSELAVLIGNKKIVSMTAETRSIVELELPAERTDIHLDDLAIAPDGYYAMEFETSSLILYDRNGAIVRSKKIPHFRTPDSCHMETNEAGDVFVTSWNYGITAYSAHESIYFDPESGDRCLFVQCKADANHLNRLKLKGERPVAIWFRCEVIVYDR